MLIFVYNVYKINIFLIIYIYDIKNRKNRILVGESTSYVRLKTLLVMSRENK